MSKQHDHSHGKKHPDPQSARQKSGKKIHHDWRFWTALALMLVAILAYVFSFDESVQIGTDVEQPSVPADAE